MEKGKITFLLTLLISIVSARGFAHDIAVANDDGVTIYYKYINNNTELAVSYRGSQPNSNSHHYSGNVVIPKSVNFNGKTYSVTSVGSYAFYECIGLTSVTIPNTVTEIDAAAFENCFYLKEFVISDGKGLLSFGYNGSMLSDSPIEFLYLGRDIKNRLPFKGKTTIKTVRIGYNVASINNNFFSGCTGLTSVSIGNSVTSIGEYAFQNCRSLKSITIPNSVTTVGDYAFENCSGLTSVSIGNSVTSIGSSAFNGCSGLTSVSIGNSVTSIGSSAFNGCSGLTSVSIGNSVTSIGSSAFRGCSGLTSVSIGNSVTSIGVYAFENCTGLTSVTIPNSVTDIGNYAFGSCSSLSSVTIGTGVLTIGKDVFYNHRPVKVIWQTNTPPNGYTYAAGSVNYVANDQYSSLSNKTVYPFLSSMFEVGGVKYVPVSMSDRTCHAIDCTYDPSAENIAMGQAVEYKGIQMNVNKIFFGLFYNNRYIKNVTIECSGIIPKSTFVGCSSLQTATLGDDITGIEPYAFYNCSKLEGIVIPNSVTSIGQYAFSNCSALTDMQIDSKVETIGSYAFNNCTSLSKIIIPQAVTKIDNYVFNGCTSLKDVYIADRNTVLTFGSNGSSSLFSECPLDSVYIGGNISYQTTSNYGYSPFYRNTTLRTVVITDEETEISANEFYGCTNLQSFTVGDGVTTFGDWAFSGCSSLKSLSFGSQLQTIGKEAFSDCTSITEITSHADTPPVCGSQALDDINKWECTLQVPVNSLAAYQAADQWKEFLFTQEEDVSAILFKLTYLVDGEVYKTYDLHYGSEITVEEEPTKEGFMFSGWGEVPETMPARDLTIRGTFAPIPVEDVSENPNYLLTANAVETQSGTQVTLPITMNNEAAITGFQFDLTLPEGFTLATGSDGRPQVTKTDRFEDVEQQLTIQNVEGNTWHFASLSQSNSPLTGTSGVILNAMMAVGEAIESGTYEGKCSNVVFTRADRTQLKLADAKFSIVVIIIGDANGNGVLDAEDVTALANYLVGRGSLANAAAADVNGDQKVDIADVTALIKLVK